MISLTLGVEKLELSWYMNSDKGNVSKVVIEACYRFCKKDFKTKEIESELF